MAYTNKLDTSIIIETQTVNADTGTVIKSSVAAESTIELADVKAYHTYVRADGTIIPTFCTLIMSGGEKLIVSNTYAAIDALINP
tara:strand:- start:1311 stop:1565 length:255 start_codon:yes stop_codon:yes gene_type:complete